MTINDEDETVVWPGRIRPLSNPGLATCLREERLCRDGVPLSTSPAEVEAVALTEWAVSTGRTLAICPVDPLAPLAELIAAGIHVADMAAQYAANRVAARSRRRVAVVTSDYRSRGLYRSLGIRSPRSRDVAPLRDVVPAATLGRDGVTRVLGRGGRGEWATLFVSSVAELDSVGAVDLAVIELPCPDARAIHDRGIPTVLIARDPADPVLTSLGDRALVLAWGPADLGRLATPRLPARLQNRLDGRGCEVVAVQDPSVCENARLFWQDVGALTSAARRSAIARDLAREAFALFYDLLGLALPLELYEQLSAPVEVRIKAVASAARLAHGDTKDLYLPMVVEELRGLAGALRPEPPKLTALKRTLQRVLLASEDVVVIARTAELGRLYRRFLDEDGLGRVRVASIGSLPETDPAEHAILTGLAPTWARWVYRCGIAKTLHVLAYSPSVSPEHHDGSFSEAAIVRRAIDDQTAHEAWLSRAAAKDQVWSALTGSPRLLSDDAPLASGGARTSAPVFLDTPPECPPGLWGGDHWLAPLEPGPSSPNQAPGMSVAASEGDKVVVEAVRVVFTDGRWVLLDVNGSVTRHRSGSAGAEPGVDVRRLEPGDQVLFLDGDSKKDLLAKVIEVAEEVPELAVAAAWLSHWRRVLQNMYRELGSYRAMRAALSAEGCTVQTQTVRLWVVGKTIGPDDPRDVYRVAVAARDEALRAGEREVRRAMRSLRGAHVRLGQRITQMAVSVGTAAATGRIAADEVIDERSGLTAADFEDSIELLTIASIAPAGQMPYVTIGRVNEAEEGARG